MNDVTLRSRYVRQNIAGKRRKKYGETEGSFLKSFIRQLIFAVILLGILTLTKNANLPFTNFFSDKVKDTLSYDMDLQSFYQMVDQVIERITGNNEDGNTKKTTGTETTPKDETSSDGASVDKTASSGAPVLDASNEETKSDEKSTAGTAQNPASTGVKQTSASQADNNKDNKYNISFVAPVVGTLSSSFGERINPISNKKEYHKGIDIDANNGDTIKSACEGKVVEAGFESTYGNYIKISHGNNMMTVYAHCSVLMVKKGQSVKTGEAIARVGSTGNSTGPHLHFEILEDGKAVNPLQFIEIKIK